MLCWQGTNLPAGTMPWKAMSVCGRVAPCGSYERDNGEAGAGGQPPRRAFPKAFIEAFVQGFCRGLYRGYPQLSSRRTPGNHNHRVAIKQVSNGPKSKTRGTVPSAMCSSWGSGVRRDNTNAEQVDQLFSSDLIRLSNSSNEVSPLIISPLMKKVGVELTFSTSLANFWSASILSSKA
jgi:hypothetical protein